MVELYSFDVFDTLVSRECNLPEELFSVVEKKLREKYCADYFNDDIYYGFSDIRKMAERIVANSYDKQNVISDRYTLEDIYDQLAEIQNISLDKARELEKLELETEYELSQPMIDNICLCEQLILNGKRVVLISDMYLSSAQIRKLLSKHSNLLVEIPLFVSCECGAQKATGKLFYEVKNELSADYSLWKHYGDNYYSDYLIPRAFGINAVHIEKKGLSYDTNGSLNRIKNSIEFEVNNIEITDTSKRVGYIYGGKILVPYVLWCIKVAQNNDVEDIYFIARDGYVLKEIADIIIGDTGKNIKTHYLYGSRTAWKKDENNWNSVREYFKQEVDFSKKNLFIDLQGTGKSINRVFDELKNDIDQIQLCCFFDKVSPTIGKKCRLMSFTDSNDTEFIELLGRAPHGLTLSYRELKTPHKIIAVLQDVSAEETNNIIQYIEGVRVFTKEKYREIDKLKSQKEWALLSKKYLQSLNASEDISIKEYFYDIPFRDQCGEESSSYAPRLTETEIENYIHEDVFNCGKWYRGSNLYASISRCNDIDAERIRKQHDLFLSKKIPWFIDDNNICVVIYGAGVEGKRVYMRLCNTPRINVVSWVDINAERLSESGLPVTFVNAIKNVKYDYVLVALKGEPKIEGAKHILEANGVGQECIVTLEEFVKLVKE